MHHRWKVHRPPYTGPEILSERKDRARSTLSRGLVEFVVIVVSILAAFGLDTWWDTQVEIRRVRAQLETLHTEFNTTREELSGLLVRLESLRTAVAAILPLVGPDTDVVPTDSINYLIDRSFRLGTVELKTGSVQALLASGDLVSIENPLLKALIAGWPAEVSDLRAQTRLMEANRELIIDDLHDRLPTLDVTHHTGQMDRYPRSSFSVSAEGFQRDMRMEGLFANRGMMVEDTDQIVAALHQLASHALQLLQAELDE